jgi:ABC-type multidrug transport system fused ATPase/permease subunit
MSLRRVITITLSTLSKGEKLKLLLAFILQLLFSMLELIAVLLFSILANLIVTQNLYIKNGAVRFVLESSLRIEERTVSSQIFVLSALVVCIFVLRSVFAAIYLQRLNFFFVRKSVETQGRILLFLMSDGRARIERGNKQEMQLILSRGVTSLYNKNLVGLVSLSSDAIVVLSILTALMIFDLYLAMATVISFSIVTLLVSRRTRRFINVNASKEKTDEVSAKSQMFEILDNYKDYFLNSDHLETVKKVKIPLLNQSMAATKLAFVTVFNRYLYEALLLVIMFLISALAFSRFDTRVALSVLATFVLGLTRLLPAILRIQQIVNSMRMALPLAKVAAELVEVAMTNDNSHATENFNQLLIDCENKLVLDKVSFEFEQSNQVLEEINIEFTPKQTTVIVGPSGTGKTTLLDIISGIRVQSSGSVKWSGLDLKSAIRGGQLKIGYVPQEVKLINGTLIDNVLMNRNQISVSQVREAFQVCDLDSLVKDMGETNEIQLGDGERRLSGGEIQKIGLARAIVANPQILILDEFTSSLDLNSEGIILRKLFEYLTNTIVISVAHRKSAIKRFDRVLELSHGRISFDGPTELWTRSSRGR